ncbi:radical SAM domain-containing protein, partial [mine drainage metagenome]
MRKIEASLMDAGIDARIVHPGYLDRYLPGQAKVLLISGHDYFGLNPPSSTFSGVMHKEPMNCVNFKRMLTQSCVVQARQQGLKIIGRGTVRLAAPPPRRG